MALTLESEQRLERASLIEFYTKAPAKWKRLARQSYQFVEKNFPEGATIHQDDVAKALMPLLEVNERLIDVLSAKRLKQRYWIRDFCALILDRTWDEIRQ